MPNINVRLTVSGTVIIAALVAFLFVTKELLNKVTLLGACWFLAFSLPAIAYRPAFAWYGYDYLDHRDFLPFVGLVLPLVSVAAKHQVLKKRPGQIAFAATTVVFAVVGARLRESYRNPFEYFSSAIRSNPTAMAYTTRGALWADNKDPRQAMDDFDNAIRLRPSFAKPWFNKGKLNMEQGNYPDAIDAFTRELKLEANDADARVGLGNAYAQTGNTAAALECYAKAIETGARADLAYFGRARIKKDERDYEGALDDLRKAIDLRPAFREAHFQMGLILASTGNFTASLGHIARAIDLDPGDPAQYYFRGRDWIELHDTAKACADFETAAKLGHSTAPQMLKRYCR
jgi:tetratricopeptide (TPR) repeat protein